MNKFSRYKGAKDYRFKSDKLIKRIWIDMEVIVRQECGTQCPSGVETMREFYVFFICLHMVEIL